MSDMGGGLDGRLAEGTHMTGTLEFERAVQIDGRFEGTVKSPGKLILGRTARVKADISVGELEVQGTLRGKVEAKGRLLIREGGTVEANIVAGKLAIETGAVFRGSCDMPGGSSTSKPESGGVGSASDGPKSSDKPSQPAPKPGPGSPPAKSEKPA